MDSGVNSLIYRLNQNICALSITFWYIMIAQVLVRFKSSPHHQQCCRFSRIMAKVTPKIIYFYYQKNTFIGSNYPKIIIIQFCKKFQWSWNGSSDPWSVLCCCVKSRICWFQKHLLFCVHAGNECQLLYSSVSCFSR